MHLNICIKCIKIMRILFSPTLTVHAHSPFGNPNPLNSDAKLDYVSLNVPLSHQASYLLLLLSFGGCVVVRQSGGGIDRSGINQLCQWTLSLTTNWLEIKSASFTMAVLSTCVNGFKRVMMFPGACYFTQRPLKDSFASRHLLFKRPVTRTEKMIMFESSLLTSAKNNLLARGGCRPATGAMTTPVHSH